MWEPRVSRQVISMTEREAQFLKANVKKWGYPQPGAWIYDVVAQALKEKGFKPPRK